MLKTRIKFFLSAFQCLRFKIKNGIKNNVYIGARTKIVGGQYICIGKSVQIRHDCFLACHKRGKLVIENGCDLGNRFRCGCATHVHIGKNVLTGPNVYISDCDHEYRNIDKPVLEQGTFLYDHVIIGDDSWIGTNVVIVGNVTIGKHCVIGANSVVNKNLPDFSVAVGCPARVIKKYDVIQRKWIKC